METVLVLMSPIMCKASFRAWYIRSMSSLRWAWSADSSIKLFWSAEEYRYASSSEWMKSLVYKRGQENMNVKKEDTFQIELTRLL